MRRTSICDVSAYQQCFPLDQNQCIALQPRATIAGIQICKLNQNIMTSRRLAREGMSTSSRADCGSDFHLRDVAGVRTGAIFTESLGHRRFSVKVRIRTHRR
jgi:hypothetical protein